MPTYYFQVGNTPQLSVIELEHLLDKKLSPVNDFLYSLKSKAAIDIDHLQLQSGGLVKTYQQLTHLESESEIEAEIINQLAQQTGKVVFSITNLSSINLPKFDLASIKNQLKAKNIKSRYLESGRLGLTAAVLSHHQVYEIVVIQDQEQLFLAKTISIQDIDDWTKRDRHKPYFDRKKGMLPPKVARMMVNIARNLIPENSTPHIYDPFCGSGTILMEGLMVGCDGTGSDLDLDAVRGSQENIDWLIEEYQLDKKTPAIYELDVAKSLPAGVAKSINAIVTEPFLGKPKPQADQLKNIFKGLYRTYWGAFKNWSHILKPGGLVIIVFPLVEAGKQTYNLDKLIDKISELGYTTISQPVIYSRPQAIVKRQLHFIRLQG